MTIATELERAEAIVSMLREERMGNGVFNPWSMSDVMDLVPQIASRERCRRYVAHLMTSPKLILVGEAPGYQGCHFTGVPFTSEYLIYSDMIPRLDGSRRLTSRPMPWREPSATIVWGALYDHGLAEDVVMFNAFPWHPYLEGDLHSNRTPKLTERMRGREILLKCLQLYPGVPVAAIGQQARVSLEVINVDAKTVLRHPTNGGATQFRQGLASLCVHLALAKAS